MADRHVLVTGASTGIGRASALWLDRAGWKVFAGVRKEADAESLRKGASDRLEPVLLDVTDEAQVEQVAKQIDVATGPGGLQGLVNNAGIARGGPVEYLDLDRWREQFEINVFGQVTVTKANLEAIRRATGRIVFIGSMSARVAAPLMGPYSASKAAIESIGETLRHELRQWGIHVTVIEPGAIATDIWEKGKDYAAELLTTMPPEALERYRTLVDSVTRNIDASVKRSIPADQVAKAVERALTSSRPVARHLVGFDAKAAGTFDRLLPDTLKDAVIRLAT